MEKPAEDILTLGNLEASRLWSTVSRNRSWQVLKEKTLPSNSLQGSKPESHLETFSAAFWLDVEGPVRSLGLLYWAFCCSPIHRLCRLSELDEKETGLDSCCLSLPGAWRVLGQTACLRTRDGDLSGLFLEYPGVVQIGPMLCAQGYVYSHHIVVLFCVLLRYQLVLSSIWLTHSWISSASRYWSCCTTWANRSQSLSSLSPLPKAYGRATFICSALCLRQRWLSTKDVMEHTG